MCCCRPDQVASEVANCLKLVGEVYDIFGLDFEMRLSTRPEGFLGEVDVWDRAEDALRSALDSTGREWEVGKPICSPANRSFTFACVA